MENIFELKLKEKMLTLELETTRSKIILLEQFQQSTTVTNEPEGESLKSKAVLEQTAPESVSTNPLMAISLPKGKEIANEAADKASSSLVQTVASKDSSNPLSPVALGKSKMVNLSPEQFITQRFEPNGYKKAVEKDLNQSYYVIYDGPNEGIYTDWGIVHSLITGTSTTCKKFKNLDQARKSAEIHDNMAGTEIIFKQPIVKEERKRTSLLRRPKVEATASKKDEEEELDKISHEEFRYIWNKARTFSQEDFVNERASTDDKASRSLFNFFEKAEPKLVYEAFKAGLVKTIYPSANLLELKFFPKDIIKAVKNFRTRIAKAMDRPMFIQITSSIPDWIQSNRYNPYFFIEIGLAKEKEFNPSKVMENAFPSYQELINYRVSCLEMISKKILKINEESKIKVNLVNKYCIITSQCTTAISKEDQRSLIFFEDMFRDNKIMVAPSTRISFCLKATKLFEGHTCCICLEESTSKTPIYMSGESDADDFTPYQE